MTDLTVAQAVTFLLAKYEHFMDEEATEKKLLLEAIPQLVKSAEIAKQKQRDMERIESRKRSDKAAERKKIRDAAIPPWCIENLKPGMVIKVKAASGTKLRLVESVSKTMSKYTSMTGRHVRFIRHREPDSDVVTGKLQNGGYITDHILTNVTGIVTGFDTRGRPVITPIMDLIEGDQELPELPTFK